MVVIKNKIQEYLTKNGSDYPFCIYIDYPFCLSKCKYCIYNSLEYNGNEKIAEAYKDALRSQIRDWKHILSEYTPDKLYFGGGTPNLIGTDTLKEIINSIPNYRDIRFIKSELHPCLLSEEMVDFYVNVVRVNMVSIGVQSFDRRSCEIENRVFDDPEHIVEMVHRFQKRGVWVNIDLVALFGGDEEANWEIFEKDLFYACNIVKPDCITCVPNYKTKLNYIEQIPRFRSILKRNVNNVYIPSSERMLSLDQNDIERYGHNDHWIATNEYWRYFKAIRPYSCTGPNNGASKQLVVAFGGLDKHRVYSYLPDNSFVTYSYYDSERKEIVYSLR